MRIYVHLFNPPPTVLSTWFMDDPFAETKKWSKRARILAVSMQDTSAFCNKKFGRWREGVGGPWVHTSLLHRIFLDRTVKKHNVNLPYCENHNVIWHNVV